MALQSSKALMCGQKYTQQPAHHGKKGNPEWRIIIFMRLFSPLGIIHSVQAQRKDGLKKEKLHLTIGQTRKTAQSRVLFLQGLQFRLLLLLCHGMRTVGARLTQWIISLLNID